MNEVNEGYHGHLFSNEDKDALDPAKPASADSEEEEAAEDTELATQPETTIPAKQKEPLGIKIRRSNFTPFGVGPEGEESENEDKRYI